MKNLLSFFFAAAILFAHTALGQNATTTPVGAVTISLPPGKSTMISVPMLGDSVYSGVVSALTTNTITVSGTPWTVGQFVGTTPYFVQLKSGLHSGRMLRIVANSNSTITVDTDDNAGRNVPLTVSGKAVSAGDKICIITGDTLGSLFGTTVAEIAPLVGAARASSADFVSVFDPTTQKTYSYYFNTSSGLNCWTKSGFTANMNNLVIAPGQGLGITTVTAGGVTKKLTFLGIVPDVAPAFKFESKRADRFGTTFPVDITLEKLDFGLNWVKGSRASSADIISIFNPSLSNYTTYYKKSDNNWYISGGTVSQNSVVIPAGSSIGVTTISAYTDGRLLYTVPLPYSL